jgi:hypothetical protein
MDISLLSFMCQCQTGKQQMFELGEFLRNRYDQYYLGRQLKLDVSCKINPFLFFLESLKRKMKFKLSLGRACSMYRSVTNEDVFATGVGWIISAK